MKCLTITLAITAAVSVLTTVLVFSGCSGKAPKTTDNIDLDLTTLSSTVVYSQVYCMVYEPEEYIGKTVRMRGSFATYHDEIKSKDYFALIIADATACCQQGLEFTLEGNYSYPDDYPELGTEMTVEGIFTPYEEDGNTFYELSSAKIVEQ